MAEYNEVIKQFKRMCRYTNHSGLPNECPLYCKGHGCNISHCRLLAFEDKKFQSVVMAWAAEHPEPVYPTWSEYLSKQILHGICLGKRCDYESVLEYAMGERIPAEIAQKLGIEPKEDVNE